jgi:hypothetical protein
MRGGPEDERRILPVTRPSARSRAKAGGAMDFATNSFRAMRFPLRTGQLDERSRRFRGNET